MMMLALCAGPLPGCSVLGNVYSVQNHIACPPMTDLELRAELQRDAEGISRLVGQPVQSFQDDAESLILNIRVPNKAPSSFWYGPQPVDVRMSTYGQELFIAVHKANDAVEDETVREVQAAVEKTVAASRCRITSSSVSQFDPI
ncbi:hypothetical protein [Dongia sp.]|uniref:hypothetical protein n=1 Tax=Dongia sp. TaxID=1977262 RepID=UPI00375091A4